jgi:hypothetical protein
LNLFHSSNFHHYFYLTLSYCHSYWRVSIPIPSPSLLYQIFFFWWHWVKNSGPQAC